MNSINKTPFKKRSDPFSSTVTTESKTVEEVKPAIEEKTKTIASNPFISSKPKIVEEEEKEAKVEKVATVVEKPKTTVVKQSPKKVAVPDINDANREKYTATMDKALRIRVKKAAIDLGLQVSSFIEVACLEKIEREGK